MKSSPRREVISLAKFMAAAIGVGGIIATWLATESGGSRFVVWLGVAAVGFAVISVPLIFVASILVDIEGHLVAMSEQAAKVVPPVIKQPEPKQKTDDEIDRDDELARSYLKKRLAKAKS